MSEQLDSMLSQMESKFELSFSESNLENPIGKQLNPESLKKDITNHKQSHQQSHLYMGLRSNQLDQIKSQLLKELQQSDHLQDHIDANTQQNQRKQNGSINKKANSYARQKTPNFKQNQPINGEDMQDLRKVASQQFSKTTYGTTHTKTDPKEQNPFYYKQLTMKLQKALRKICSHKGGGSNKKQSAFYDRVQQLQQKKKKTIQRKKLQLEQRQVSQVRDRPLMNSHSRSLAQQMNIDPIHIRTQKILQNKKLKSEQYKKMKQQRAEKEYQQYREQYDNYTDSIKQKYEGKSIRSSEEYYHEMQNWVRNRERNIQARIVQKNQKEKQSVTFKPLINSISQKILLKTSQKRIPIHERQPALKEQKADPKCTFKPKINKSNFYKKMTYYQSPF